MHTPQEFSRIKYDNQIRIAEHAKQVRANAIANQKVKFFHLWALLDLANGLKGHASAKEQPAVCSTEQWYTACTKSRISARSPERKQSQHGRSKFPWTITRKRR